MKSGGDYFMNS